MALDDHQSGSLSTMRSVMIEYMVQAPSKRESRPLEAPLDGAGEIS